MSGIGVVIGLVTGTLVGASAIGSGSLVLPLLLLLTPLPAAAAIGTSLALATGTKLVGYLAHRQLGHVNLGLGKWLVAGALPGTAVAVLLLRGLNGVEVSPARTRQLVGLLLVALAVMLLAVFRRSAVPLPGTGRNAFPTSSPSRRAFLVGAGVSLVVTLTAIGSGGLLMLALLLWRPAWVREMVGTTIFYGLAATLLGALAHLALNNVDGGLLVALAAGSVPGVLVGTRLTRLIPEHFYQLGVAALNLVLGLRLVWAG